MNVVNIYRVCYEIVPPIKDSHLVNYVVLPNYYGVAKSESKNCGS